MTMHKNNLHILEVILFLTFSLPVGAQEDLVNDTDITWLGTFTIDLRLDPSPGATSAMSHLDALDWNSTTVEKINSSPDENEFPVYPDYLDNFWVQKMYDLLMDQDIVRYSEPGLNDTLLFEDCYNRISRVDSLEIIEEGTFENKIIIVGSTIEPTDLYGIRLNQRLYLQKSSNSLHYSVISFAPLQGNRNNQDSLTGFSPICWFPAMSIPEGKATQIAEKSCYIVTTITRESSPKMSDFKSPQGALPLGQYYEDYLRNRTGQVFSNDGFMKLEEEDLLGLEGLTDTILWTDPETYATKVELIQHKPLRDRVMGIRLIVRWYYQEADKRLYYEFIASGPVEHIETDGGFQFKKVIFYLKSIP